MEQDLGNMAGKEVAEGAGIPMGQSLEGSSGSLFRGRKGGCW
jgi:hypothetical protein